MESPFRIGGSPAVSVSIIIGLSGGDPAVDGDGEAEHEEGDGGRVASGTKAVVLKTLSKRTADLSGRCREGVAKAEQGLLLRNSRVPIRVKPKAEVAHVWWFGVATNEGRRSRWSAVVAERRTAARRACSSARVTDLTVVRITLLGVRGRATWCKDGASQPMGLRCSA
ncbi:hypothetical protein U1Q18_034687 [Sarracenia purpurea var. burkii]